MIGTKEADNEIMRMNVDSTTCDKNNVFKFIFLSEECIKLCSSENIGMVVKGRLNHKKDKILKNYKKSSSLTKNNMFNT